jgi:hypothetical protein
MARTGLTETLLIPAGSTTAQPKIFILCPANERGDNKKKLWNIYRNPSPPELANYNRFYYVTLK